MTSDKDKNEIKNDDELMIYDDENNDNDNDRILTPTIIYARGGKEDFVSLINASNETNGWIRKYRDYDCYRRMLGPTKLHDIAARTKIGDYVGSCICMEFDHYKFISLHYVHPKYRKRGIGMELFKRIVNDNLREKNIGANVVQDMSTIYSEKFGFNKRTSWMIDVIEVKNIDKTKIIVDNDDDVHLTVKDGKEVCLQRIIDYDAKIAKYQREDFVQQWAIERIDAVCKILVNSNDKIIGYGCGRLLSIVGYPSFGPIYCDSDDGFKLLFHALYSCFDEELAKQNLIILYIPTIKLSTIQQILHLADANIQLKQQFIPQFTQAIPDHDIDKIYCLPDVTMFI